MSSEARTYLFATLGTLAMFSLVTPSGLPGWAFMGLVVASNTTWAVHRLRGGEGHHS